MAITRLALLAIALAHPYAATLDAAGAVDDALTAAGQSDCGGTSCAAILVDWSYHESGWGKETLGDCKDSAHRTLDTCKAYGAMQTVMPEQWVKGATPERVVKDRVLSFQVGFAILRYTLGACKNNLRGALGLYASGKKCGWASQTVAFRCGHIGC